jgi:hypothetical protein
MKRDTMVKITVFNRGITLFTSEADLMAELYQVLVKTVNEYLVNIYNEGELAPRATIRKFRIVQTEGARRVSRMVDHYNLDAILAVGYRVRSTRGTAFRQWATARLREYIVKGFTLDSYIISTTPFKDLRKRYGDGTWDKKKFADAHILFQEHSGEYDYMKTIFLSQAIG